jgi:hypothetical protein
VGTIFRFILALVYVYVVHVGSSETWCNVRPWAPTLECNTLASEGYPLHKQEHTRARRECRQLYSELIARRWENHTMTIYTEAKINRKMLP